MSKEAASSRATKAWLIGALWVAQFVVFYAGPSLFLGIHEWSGEVWSDLKDPDYLIFGLAVATIMSGVQGAFLLPIRAPLAKESARPSRLRLLAIALSTAAVVAGVVAYVVMGLREAGLLRLRDNQILAVFGGAWVVLVAPVFVYLIRKFKNGLPVLVSMVIAAGLAGVILFGLVAGVAGVVRLIANSETPRWVWYWILYPAPLVGWVVFTPLIVAFVKKGTPEVQLSKVASRLLIGTTVEAVAIIPVEVMVRKRSDCYCDEASFWSLVAAMSVGFVTLGPAIFLLGWKRYQLRMVQGRCRACGYDMSATPKAERCPECGVGWKMEVGTGEA